MPRISVFALAISWWCACTIPYTSVAFTTYSTEIGMVRYESANVLEYRVPQGMTEPLPAVPYTGWFVPSRWVVQLAERFKGLPDAFDPRGPEYCSVIFVDEDRRVHASIPVRRLNSLDANRRCPTLGAGAGERGTMQVGIAHQHPVDSGPSDMDLNLAPTILQNGEIVRTGAVVEFFSGKMLSGIDPETGGPAAVPAQHFLIAKHAGKLYVLMWVRVVHPRPDRRGAVVLYVPARNGTDDWKRASECWLHPEAGVREFGGTILQALCDPADIWQ